MKEIRKQNQEQKQMQIQGQLQMYKRKISTRDKGITLIALVVTIIVLLILAGITISMVLGENGILTRSKRSKELYQIGKEKEEIELAYASVRTGKESERNSEPKSGADYDTITPEDMKEEIEKSTSGVTTEWKDETNRTIKITYPNGNEYVVSQEGEIIEEPKKSGGNTPANPTEPTDPTKTGEITINGEKLTATNAKNYYGMKVSKKSYNPEGDTTGVYRVFYYDATGNEFSNGVPTLYLKRDCDGSNSIDGETLEEKFSGYTGSDDAVAEMRRMNPMWKDANSTLTKYEDVKNYNAKIVAYLCDKTKWEKYADKKIEDCYAIGGPSIEMYYKSYMAVEHKESGKTDWTIDYPTENNYGGGYSQTTGANSLDYKGYHSMYCGIGESNSGNWWLASPSSGDNGNGLYVFGGGRSLLSRYVDGKFGVCPLVSIKAKTGISIEFENE